MDTASIDRALAPAAEDARIGGFVAAAADAHGIIYQGAFGRRDATQPMTTDTVFRVASMTKAVTATAVMQLVETGALRLDQPAREILPFLAETCVLEGFDAAGTPMLRAPRTPITLRHLLTHTAGYVYDTWDEVIAEYAALTGLPLVISGKLASLKAPLRFDPGERWEYGINLDVAGRMVDVVSGLDLEIYMRRHIFEPLAMADTSYIRRPGWGGRLAAVQGRQPDGPLQPIEPPPDPGVSREFFPGGNGLFSTATDYLRFLRALMNGGTLDGHRILREETVALMARNHIGDLDVRPLPTHNPGLSNSVDLLPGMRAKWGLSFLINPKPGPAGRSAGSLAWGGLYNTYYWLDPRERIAGVFLAQLLPFTDPAALATFAAFERALYAVIGDGTLPHDLAGAGAP